MSELPVPYRRGALSKIEGRQAELKLAKLRHDAALEKERLRLAAEIEAVRVDSQIYVGRRAMRNVAFLSEFEELLARLSPTALSRVSAMADITCLSIAEMVSESARKLQ
jgi:hypothetical protein